MLLDFASRMPFEEASDSLAKVGFLVSPAGLERLVHRYGERHRLEVAEDLGRLAEEPLQQGKGATAQRVMVVQADGVVVLGRREGEQGVKNVSEAAEAGGCPGCEVKVALVYPNASPSQRVMVADAASVDEFEPLVHGLLRQARVKQTDTLVGVGDGAGWVERLFENLGAARVLDVYHACEYLETVMSALGWDGATRAEERRLWCRGEVDGATWLRDFEPGEAKRLSWGEKARTAWAYLARQAAAGALAYPSFRARDWPIGSG